ncbi:lipase family alpha/beta hydrolase [Streptomyces telluris]|uniref:DUF676 domain-containing protein n=1 Tax=Streptomyces telluris TaxID=2720021 RepID=A0A9X2LJY6_9ACTN|nr:hypothetical protein [Streptomyces telluris]MCQ8772252.1 hypothetical protein [Streptomyces telluris]NJP75747.1 hypothetical protein [Streptomyces telluris]
MKDVAAVFVHGLFSTNDTWKCIDNLIGSDSELSGLTLLKFDYASPKYIFNPLRRVPDFDVLADSLQTFLEVEAKSYGKLAIISHSQGGLIVQRFLARMVSNARGEELARIKRVIMFACPNSGSEIFLLARKSLKVWRHPHERELRPINEPVTSAHKAVINRIIHAQTVASDRCPITIRAYAGDLDKIVTPTSARSVFPDTGVIPGDHFSIIRPDSHTHRTYTTLKDNLIAALVLDSSADPLPTSAMLTSAPIPVQPAPEEQAPTPTSSEELGGPTQPAGDPSQKVEEPPVIVRWNPRTRTVDFIVTPETALIWVKNLGQEGDEGER